MNRLIKRLLTEHATLASHWRRWQLTLHDIDIHPTCTIAPLVAADRGFANGTPGQIHIASQVSLEQGVMLHAWGGNITIQESVFIGPYTVIYGHGGVVIGKDTLIAMHCRILSSNHTIPDRARHIRWEPDQLLPTKIGSDVWLGAGVTVLGGVTIGDGCVVGAGAVVTKDLPASAIAIGIPTKIIGQRQEHSLPGEICDFSKKSQI